MLRVGSSQSETSFIPPKRRYSQRTWMATNGLTLSTGRTISSSTRPGLKKGLSVSAAAIISSCYSRRHDGQPLLAKEIKGQENR